MSAHFLVDINNIGSVSGYNRSTLDEAVHT